MFRNGSKGSYGDPSSFKMIKIYRCRYGCGAFMTESIGPTGIHSSTMSPPSKACLRNGMKREWTPHEYEVDVIATLKATNEETT